MPRPQKTDSLIEGAEVAAAALAGFDYGVDDEDFVLYELHRLIDEEKASFDDPEFRTLIDTGIRAHVTDSIDIRVKLVRTLQGAATDKAQTVVSRIVNAVSDLDSDLCNVGVLVRSYTTYLLSKLEALSNEGDAEVDDKIADAADLLFEATGDRDASETALKILCETRSPVCGRVLAHAVSEPLLDEDLEARAFAALRNLWPLPRHYMLYNLQGHPHEDIPFRWFQLFVEVDELTTVDLVLEELRAHGESPDYHEDLAALLDVLHGCGDPELEDKILGTLNASSTPAAVAELLRKFLEDHQPVPVNDDNAWKRAARELDSNRERLLLLGRK